jgi:hypothetical protein
VVVEWGGQAIRGASGLCVCIPPSFSHASGVCVCPPHTMPQLEATKGGRGGQAILSWQPRMIGGGGGGGGGLRFCSKQKR